MASNNTKAQFWVGVRNTFTTVIGFIVAAYFFKTIEAIASEVNSFFIVIHPFQSEKNRKKLCVIHIAFEKSHLLNKITPLQY